MSQIAAQISNAISQTTSQLGQSITYTPVGGGSPSSFSSVVEQVDSVESESHSLMTVVAERRNFLIQVSDYAAVPAAGDVITYDGDSYTLMIPEEKRDVWEWNDKFNLRRRVFTNRTA